MAEDDAQKCFLAARTDGLGERLRAMINAMILAEHFGVAFKFQWQERGPNAQQHHAIVSPKLTFNRGFLSRHFVADIAPEDYPPLTGRHQPPAAVRTLLASPIKGLTVSQEPIHRLVDLSKLRNLRGQYGQAFRRIKFTPKVSAAIAAARTALLPDNCVAIHLRAGDIIYGSFRFASAATTKAVCYPVVKRLIADLIAEGKYPLIFGQDKIVCRMLADRFQLRLAADILPHDDILSAAVSEIVLMSRCQEIHAGSSGFSILASQIGNRPLKAPTANWTPEQIVHCIIADDEIDDPSSTLPDLQRAFAFYMIAHAGIGIVANTVVIRALARALHYDKGNPFYALNKASLEAIEGDTDSTEATLKAIVDGEGPAAVFGQTALHQAIRRAVVKRKVTERMAVPACLHILARLATAERPYISYITALAAFLAGETAEATRVAAQAAVCDPENPQFRYLLELCRRTAAATGDTGPVAEPVAEELLIAVQHDGFGKRLKAMLNGVGRRRLPRT